MFSSLIPSDMLPVKLKQSLDGGVGILGQRLTAKFAFSPMFLFKLMPPAPVHSIACSAKLYPVFILSQVQN